HEVHVVRQVLPGAGDAAHVGLAAELALGADFPGDAGHFGSKRPELIHHRVDRVLEFQDLAADIDRDLLGEIAIRDGGGDFGDVANGDLSKKITVDVRGEILELKNTIN